MGAIMKYCCIRVIVLNSDAIGDYYCINLAMIQYDTWSRCKRIKYIAGPQVPGGPK
jgi:hypothetical protein